MSIGADFLGAMDATSLRNKFCECGAWRNHTTSQTVIYKLMIIP